MDLKATKIFWILLQVVILLLITQAIISPQLMQGVTGLCDKFFTDKEEANKYIFNCMKELTPSQKVMKGIYNGFEFVLEKQILLR